MATDETTVAPISRVGAGSSPAHEQAVEEMLADRLDQFENGLRNLADATKRRFDQLEEKIDRLLSYLGG